MKTLLIALLLMASPAYANIIELPKLIVDTNVVRVENEYLFTLLFSHDADIGHPDQFNRLHETFQWYITSDLDSTRPMAHNEFIVRGEAGDVLLCASGPSGGGCPGGWGPILGDYATNYDAPHKTLSFSIDADELPNAFAYDVISVNYGSQVDGWWGTSEGDDSFRWAPFTPVFGIGPPQVGEAGSWVLVLIGCAILSSRRFLCRIGLEYTEPRNR